MSFPPQSFAYPGAVWPQPINPPVPSVLSYTNAFPNLAFPQHLSGQSAVQSFLYPGAVQPQVFAAAAGASMIFYGQGLTIPLSGTAPITVTVT